MIDAHEIKNRIKGMYAPPHSEEGQKVIHEGRDDEGGKPTHVKEVWEDGEITYTKCGDLYGARRTHGLRKALLPVGFTIFDAEEDFEDFDEYNEVVHGSEHKRMVITDGELIDILDEYRGCIIDQEAVDVLKDAGKWSEPGR